MRYHASCKKEGYEQFYAEMQLFFPWRDEVNDLYSDDQNKCIEKFGQQQVQDVIRSVKNQMFPFCKASIDISNIWKENGNDCRPSHIYDTLLDSTAVQENEDALDEPAEDIARPDTNFDQCDDLETNTKDQNRFKSFELADDDELNRLARSLVPEQLMILQGVVKLQYQVI